MKSTSTCIQCIRISCATSRLERHSTSSMLRKQCRSISTKGRESLRTSTPNITSCTQPKRLASSLEGLKTELNSDRFTPPPADLANPPRNDDGRLILKEGNLFHPYSQSPSPQIRRRAAFMKHNAYCSHPDHHSTRMATLPVDPELRKSNIKPSSLPPAHVSFECPDCGIPVSCSEEHWADDYESHLEICDTLREINEDDHDLRSGRFFPEFEYPPNQIEEALVNMTNWDTFLYSREFPAINEPRSMRQATKLLTYPVTIASVLSELSPYNIRRGGRLTTEGLKSFSGTYFFNLL